MTGSVHGQVRRRMMAANGRPMVLRRPLTVNPPTYQDVVLQGFQRAYRPEQLSANLHQGDSLIAICANEIQAAGWPAPPRAKDQMIIDGRTWAIEGSQTLCDGTEVIGYDLWVRGGL